LPQPPIASALASASFTRSAALTIAACVAWLAPAQASAWCRASDEVGREGACVPIPSLPFLFWKRSCTAYRFNQDFFDQFDMIDEHEMRTSFKAAFDTWASVDCDGRGGFYVEQRASTTSTAKSEYLRDRPSENEMVVLALDSAQWASLPDHSPRAVALTLMWHNKKTGEILDTDMELNLGAGTFADCVAGSCQSGMIDMQNTITHEAGHVLGLGHSTDTSATMTAQTVGVVDTQKRSLEADDSAGYCALNLPEWSCKNAACSCSEAPLKQTAPPLRDTAGCNVATVGTGAASWAWLGAALTGLRRLRKRRRSQSPNAASNS
jgi:MYXO-CTERM domain-containing protein